MKGAQQLSEWPHVGDAEVKIITGIPVSFGVVEGHATVITG